MKFNLKIAADHPSQHELERFHAGDLEDERRQGIETHLSSCGDCSAFLAELESLRDEFSSSHSKEAFLSMVRDRAESASHQGWWTKFVHPSRQLTLVYGFAIMTIVALFSLGYWYLYENPNPDTRQDTRIKGSGISLSYLVMEDGKPVLAKRGRILHPRDRIQFRLSAPRGGYVHIVGVDEAGTVTVYFPLPNKAPEVYPGGSARPVPGSIILDDTLGRERIFLLICTKPIKRSVLESEVLTAARDPKTWISSEYLPLECKQTSILLHKDLAP